MGQSVQGLVGCRGFGSALSDMGAMEVSEQRREQPGLRCSWAPPGCRGGTDMGRAWEPGPGQLPSLLEPCPRLSWCSLAQLRALRGPASGQFHATSLRLGCRQSWFLLGLLVCCKLWCPSLCLHPHVAFPTCASGFPFCWTPFALAQGPALLQDDLILTNYVCTDCFQILILSLSEVLRIPHEFAGHSSTCDGW